MLRVNKPCQRPLALQNGGVSRIFEIPEGHRYLCVVERDGGTVKVYTSEVATDPPVWLTECSTDDLHGCRKRLDAAEAAAGSAAEKTGEE